MTHGPPKVIGPYEILRELGSGGMGVVYLAKTSTASKVAVKVMQRNLAKDADIRARFMSEVDHLRMAFGARVARSEDADLEADEPWLAVEYVPGLTLREHLEQHDVLAPKFGAILGAVLAEGVESIHKAGLVHRDLKPAWLYWGNLVQFLADETTALSMLSGEVYDDLEAVPTRWQATGHCCAVHSRRCGVCPPGTPSRI